MSFTWTAPKGQGLYILKEVLTEMRTNTDYLDDNPAPCLTNNGTRYDSEFITNQTSEYTGDNNPAATYDFVSHYSPRCDIQNNGSPP